MAEVAKPLTGFPAIGSRGGSLRRNYLDTQRGKLQDVLAKTLTARKSARLLPETAFPIKQRLSAVKITNLGDWKNANPAKSGQRTGTRSCYRRLRPGRMRLSLSGDSRVVEIGIQESKVKV